MKAIVIRELGSPDVMKYEDVGEPIPLEDEVLVAVQFASVEGGDHTFRTQVPISGPYRILGFQASGTIERVGSRVTTFKPGDPVVAFNIAAGSYAEKFVAPAQTVFPLPKGLHPRHAAAIPTTFATADEALFEFGRLKPGEVVFVHGGAGGVGLAAIQLARQAGAIVYATARTRARAARLEQVGAHCGIAYDEEDYAERVTTLTQGEGVDLVIDLVGGDSSDTARLLSTVRRHGRIGFIGMASGIAQSIGFWELLSKNLTVFGLSPEIASQRVRETILRHLASVAAGNLHIPIEQEFPLSQAVEAHRFAEDRHPFGRVLLRCDSSEMAH